MTNPKRFTTATRDSGRMRRFAIAGGAVLAAAIAPATAALASSSARPATHSERSALIAAYRHNDGNSSAIRGVYISRSSSSLGVVCTSSPEAGVQAAVFQHSGRSWRLVAQGRAGHAGTSTDKRLETACG